MPSYDKYTWRIKIIYNHWKDDTCTPHSQPWVVGVVANQMTVRKHGVLSVICCLPHTMYPVFSNTLPPPPCIGQGDGISLLEYWLCLSFGIEVITVCGVHLEYLSNLCAEQPLRGQAVWGVFSSFLHIKINHVYLFFLCWAGQYTDKIQHSILVALCNCIGRYWQSIVYTKVYTVLLVNISTVYFLSVVMSNFSADNVITHSFYLFYFSLITCLG